MPGTAKGRRTLQAEITLLLSLVALFAVLLIGALVLLVSDRIIRDDLQKQARRTLDEISEILITPLWTLSDETVIDIGRAYLSSGRISAMRVESFATGILVDSSTQEAHPLGPYEAEVIRGTMPLGKVILWFSIRPIQEARTQLLISLIVVTLALLAAIMGGSYLMARTIVFRHLSPIFTGISKISDGNYDTAIGLSPYADLNLLIDLLNTMSRNILEKDQALLEAKEGLEEKVRQRSLELETASERLRKAERMLSMGTLVTGISHELNTPLGNALTAVSFMQEMIEKPGALEKKCSPELRESVHLIQNNITRAIHLVQNFRDLILHQESDEPEEFVLLEHLWQLSLVSEMQMKEVSLKVHISGDSFVCRTRKSALNTILTQIMLNSVQHGYRGNGPLDITVRREQNRNIVVFRDYGRGMTIDVMARAFEPFFTTDRGSGKIGLGLYIVYSMATDHLGGEIQMENHPGGGLQVSISFPDIPS